MRATNSSFYYVGLEELMKISIRFLPLTILFALILVGAACQSTTQNANTTATTAATPPGEQKLTQVPVGDVALRLVPGVSLAFEGLTETP